MQILFLGVHGQFNIGDELLLETFVNRLGNEHTYIVNSYNPTFTQNAIPPQFNIESFHTTKELPRFLKYLFACDLLFFGGGNIIKELPAGIGRNPYSKLLKILATVTIAKKIARKKIVMSNIGIGPLTTLWGQRLACWILSQVDILSVRDEASHQTAIMLGLSPMKVNIVPDVVFANPPDVFLHASNTRPFSNRIRIALNLNYDIENPKAWEPFLVNLETALRQLNDEKAIEVHALPMQSKFKANDDLSVLKEFSQRLPKIPFTIHEPQTAQEVAKLIHGTDMVLAERLHTLAIASILGKPFFGLVYDAKVRELMGCLSMEKHSININQSFTYGDLKQGMQTVLANRETIGAHLAERSANLRGKLSRYFDDLKIQVFAK